MDRIEVVKTACAILQTIRPLEHSPAREIANRTFNAVMPSLSGQEVAAFALLLPETDQLGSDWQGIMAFPMEASFNGLISVPEIGTERRQGIQDALVTVCQGIITELITDLQAVVA